MFTVGSVSGHYGLLTDTWSIGRMSIGRHSADTLLIHRPTDGDVFIEYQLNVGRMLMKYQLSIAS